MARTIVNRWNPGFYRQSPVFAPLENVVLQYAQLNDWPTLELLNRQFAEKQLSIRTVPQGTKPRRFEENYEPRIYLKGELQTRTQNWHDFFNAMVWLQFSRTKRELNRLHYFEAFRRKPGSNRTPLENAITLFDECGCIIVSSSQKLLDLIQNHQWTELFVEYRSAFVSDIQCYVFGHAMYEKALKPYIGMTCQAMLIDSPSLINASLDEIDGHVARLWASGNIQCPADLAAFPLLGVPGWYHGEQSQAFYDNTDYFRPRRNKS